MRRFLFGIPLLLLLAACSSLKVEVSIADPSIGRTALDELRLRDDLPFVLAKYQNDVDLLILKATREHVAILSDLIAEQERAAAAEPDLNKRALIEAAAKSIGEEIIPTVSLVYESRKGILFSIAEELRSLCPVPGGCPPEKMDRVTALMRRWATTLNGLVEYQQDELGGHFKQMSPELRAKAVQAQANVEDLRSLIGKAGLQTAPEAYAVINAPKNKWKKRFDLSKALGRLGDLNVAIKMEQRGNFTIKGVSFDPSEVARAISKMGTQLVLAIAQVNGVPVRGSTAQGLPTSSEALGAAMTAVETTSADQADRREALLTIASAITRERDKIEADDAIQRKAAIKATQDTFNAHKSRISTTPAPAPVPAPAPAP